ncbi:MAG: hypothetical protein AB1481_06980, partial [Candidatus Omnitrophota bacterium]
MKKVLVLGLCLMGCLLGLQNNAQAFTLNVVDTNGNPIAVGYRWLLEEDTTHYTTPGAQVANSIGLEIHNSYAPVITKGHSATSSAIIDVPGTTRYFVSVLPDSGYSISGTSVNLNQLEATVKVHAQPIPTAQISVITFVDQNPINDAIDEHDITLGGCRIILSDAAGQVTMDALGNPLGTMYDAGGNV